MLPEEEKKLSEIGSIPEFKTVLEKLTTNIQLSRREEEYILGVSILLLEEYQKDKRLRSYADFSYYLILKYSLQKKDFKPLYDLSTNLGFYPITESILRHGLLKSKNIDDIIITSGLNKFKNIQNYTETQEQYLVSRTFLKDDSNEKSYLAPTSFGKSSIIIRTIENFKAKELKIAIIVPTKSLLMQTYSLIRRAKLGMKVIMHDEMYSNEKSFIAVFTQERALRLMSRKRLSYDVLFIDEAHNILNGDNRSILLSRLLFKNNQENTNQKVIYLSPLVDNIENIKVIEEQDITSHVINHNVKEPELYEYRLDSELFKYNRHVNQFYSLGKQGSFMKYIINSSKDKNFVYNYRPIKIEAFAKQLSNSLNEITENTAIDNIRNILEKEVHSKFYAIEYLKYGVVYLHGQLPDLVKEFLEYKYKTEKSLKYVIANTVILEGMNLPIECLFILNTRNLNGKELINLIGRVNRLNDIFSQKENNLRKLTPDVHFMNNIFHHRKGSSMTNKIRLLRNRTFSDTVKNPILKEFDIDKQSKGKTNKELYIKNIQAIQENEKFLSEASDNIENQIRKYLIESGIVEYFHYDDMDELVKKINRRVQFQRIQKSLKETTDWDSYTILEKIHAFFILNFDIIKDFEINRLANIAARNYYENFILIGRKRSLKQNIIAQVKYFKKIALSNQPKFYFGKSYGEVALKEGGKNKIYVDLSGQNESKLINLAIIKLKMEDNFVSFKLNKFIIMLYDFDLITKEEYNLYIYGTTDESKINLTKFGLSISLINRLSNDGQLTNLSFDDYNNLVANDNFKSFINEEDELYRFEVMRYLN